MSRRARAPTLLKAPAPLPRDGSAPPTPPEVARVVYTVPGAGGRPDLELIAWYAHPHGPGPFPAIVYFHGDFTFEAEDYRRVAAWALPHGYAVMTPMLRGENGNPGELELLWGEVEDAAEAVRWLANRAEVDDEQIFAVGHSIGGAIAALLCVVRDVPLVRTASIGGIYVPETFQRWSKMPNQSGLVRFDPDLPHEGELRTLGPQLDVMARPHHAFVGDEDRWFIDNVERVEARASELGAPMTSSIVEGDHMTSLESGLASFFESLPPGRVAAPGVERR